MGEQFVNAARFDGLERHAPVFDEASHRYTHPDGRRLISVTQAIQAAGLVNTDWFNEAAAWRGSVVHKCCELDCKGTLLESSVDPAALPYLQAWRAWKQNVGFTPTKIEQRHYHPTLLYSGTQDRAGYLPNGEECDVDLKTGVAQKWHAIQLAAYGNFHRQPRTRRRFTVRLQPDGRYVTTEYTNATWSQDWAAFQSCLVIANWRQINGC